VRKDVTSHTGVLVVRDSERRSGTAFGKDEDPDLEEVKKPKIGEDASEPEPPEAFEFTAADDEWAAAAAPRAEAAAK
jgi:hypothetical protein